MFVCVLSNDEQKHTPVTYVFSIEHVLVCSSPPHLLPQKNLSQNTFQKSWTLLRPLLEEMHNSAAILCNRLASLMQWSQKSDARNFPRILFKSKGRRGEMLKDKSDTTSRWFFLGGGDGKQRPLCSNDSNDQSEMITFEMKIRFRGSRNTSPLVSD